MKSINIFIILTNACNSKCVSCNYWKSPATPRHLNSDKLFRFLTALSTEFKINSVFLTGGEPLLHPEVISIASHVKRTHNPYLNLSTNGILLEKHLDKINGLIDSYCISYDAHNSALYKEIRGVSGFNRINRIPELTKKPTVANCLISKLNCEYIPSIYYSAKEFGFSGINFLVPDLSGAGFGRASKEDCEEASLFPELAQIETLKNAFIEIISLERTTKRRYFLNKPTHLLKFLEYFSGKVENDSRTCEVHNRTLVITESGQIKPCFYLPGALGNIDDTESINFTELRNSSKTYNMNCLNCWQFM